MLEIIKHPNEILRRRSQTIDLEQIKQADFKKLLKEMSETMLKKDGVGLAAPQIGQNIRLIVINKDGQGLAMINPELTKKSWAKESDLEGCLSVLDEKGEIYYKSVLRHKKVSCSYFDAQGKRKKMQAEGLLARVLQHEIDHLNGILFIDRLEEK